VELGAEAAAAAAERLLSSPLFPAGARSVLVGADDAAIHKVR